MRSGLLRVCFVLALLVLEACSAPPLSGQVTPIPGQSLAGRDSPLPTPSYTRTPLPPNPTATTTPVPPKQTPWATRAVVNPTPLLFPRPTPGPADLTVCASGCDFGTIQAAIDDPGTQPGCVIEVLDALHTEAGITVTKSLTIRGRGALNTTVQAHSSASRSPDRIFLIPEDVTVTIQAMTIRHGKPGIFGDCGGALRNYGTVTLEDCIVRDNVANDGGGLCNDGSMTLINCTIQDNVGNRTGPPGIECGSGGGIKHIKGFLMIVNSTISGNHAEGKGGGIHISCQGAAVVSSSSTISGNHAVANGGGIYVRGFLQLVHGTVCYNSTDSEGGGINVRGSMDFMNSIVAANAGGRDCFISGPGGYQGRGQIGLNRYNLIGDNSCDPAYSGDPLLGPLADNGGRTQTHSLLSDSPAVDAIPADACTLDMDQRGFPRPVEQTSSGQPCDIGALERQAD